MAPPSRPRKAVYVCPTCGHESPVDGDWLVVRGEQRVVYACPVCGRPVTAQPRLAAEGPDDGDGGGSGPLALARRGLASAMRAR